MADTFAFITLSCPSCGGKLEIYDDMDRFACSYCGSEMLVQRRGGAVSLKTVENAIRRVQVGTDKTAAELALPRLQAELQRWVDAESAILSQPLIVPPPLKSSLAFLVFGVIGVLFAPLWVWVVEWSTNWNRHEVLLRVELWVAASVIFLCGMWMFLHGHRRQAIQKAQSIEILHRLEDARLKDVGEVRIQIERVRIRMRENRRILDS